MPTPPSIYSSGPVSPQQLNSDFYSFDGNNFHANGILFHARRPLLSQTLIAAGTVYAPLAMNRVFALGAQAYTVIDTTALLGTGADFPGTFSRFQFQDNVLASSGSATTYGGQWLVWNFPIVGAVTAPPGGVGAGMELNNSFNLLGTFQYGSTLHVNTPYYFDMISAGPGTANIWESAFWWLTASTPVTVANSQDTTGQTCRMGWLWHCVVTGGATVSTVPAVSQSWGTVTSAAFNTAGSALTLLNNPPALRVVGGAQSITNNTTTVLQFGSATSIDNYSGWSTATSVYTVPLPGLYLFCPNIAWGTASSSSGRICGLQVTAGTITTAYQGPIYQATPVGPGVSGVGLTATAVVRVLSLNAGDKVNAYGFQNSGVTMPLYPNYANRFVGAWMGQQAAAGTTLSYTPPVTSFRWQAGALSGTALTGALNARIGNDMNFLLNKPYFTGYQATAQTGFANSSGFHQVIIDTIGAQPRGGNGDNYGGWSAANHWYVSQVAGWYLVLADLYPVAPISGTIGVLTAGIFCSSSGSITPSSTPDNYQEVCYPIATGGAPPGGFAAGLYYLLPGEYVYPMLSTTSWGGTWGTFVNSANTAATVHSQFSVFWVSELRANGMAAMIGSIVATATVSSGSISMSAMVIEAGATTASSAATVFAILASAVIVLGGLAALVRAIWKTATTLRDNTTATQKLTEKLEEYVKASDGRFDALNDRVTILEHRSMFGAKKDGGSNA